MDDTLLIAILAGLGGMLGWGAADFFAKKTIDRIGDLKTLVWAHAFGTSFFIVLALGQTFLLQHTFDFPDSSMVWAGLIFFGVLQMLVYWLVYIGFGKGQLAVLNPIFASYSGIVALISILVLNEKLHLLSAIALVAVFGGIILLNVDLEGLRSKRLNLVPGLKEVVTASLLAAIWTIGWDKFVGGHNALVYALFMYTFMTLTALVLAYLLKVKLRGVDPDLWKFLALIGLGETVAYLAISWGFSATPLTSIVALISGAFSLPTILLAYIFLKERLTPLQVGAVCSIVTGIIMLAIK